MRTARRDDDGWTAPDDPATQVLGAAEERQLLRELAESKRKLAEALAQIPGAVSDPQALAQTIAAARGPAGARLGAIFLRYSELRSRLALANLRLVAHVAKKFRDRGIASADLLQEGFCGLLEAIDRFDLAHQTKLATYATWWIRQAMQRALAAGAYPVRLDHRHLRRLARHQDGADPTNPAADPGAALPEPIRRIQAATRPTVSLDATLDSATDFRLSLALSDPAGDPTGDRDANEAVARLLQSLPPRERQVLALRFGLGGRSRHSLGEVGMVLGVSKERVRQIQERALRKLRALAAEDELEEVLAGAG